MNAPTKAKDLVQPNVELLPLTTITPSETKVQAARRRGYSSQAIEDLATSIRDSGVLQPIVVRPLAALRGLAKYELVAGERRWLASEKAGQAHILARIVELTDEQVLKAQLVENLHREKLDTLAEARGFRELIDSGVNADAIGALIGLSRSYVYARVKLLELAPAVQEALQAGKIDASQALLFARIPSTKLQEQALSTLDKWSYQGHGEKLSFRRTAEILGDKMKGVLIPLTQVPFRHDDDTFFTFGPKDNRGNQDMVSLPACVACPKRSGNDPELLAVIDDANVCTDKACHDVKAKQEFERRRKSAEAAGKEVLTGEAAAAITPTQYGTRGWIDLDDVCEDDEYPGPLQRPKGNDWESPEYQAYEEACDKWQSRTYRQILGADVGTLEIQLVQDPKNKSRLREMASDTEVTKLLKAKGIKTKVHRDTRKPEAPPKPVDPEKARLANEKAAREEAEAELEQKISEEYGERLREDVWEAWKGPVKRDELELIADHLLDDYSFKNAVGPLLGKKATPSTMSDRELTRAIVVGILLQRWEGDGDSRPFEALAKRLKIDTKALEKEVRAEFTPNEPSPAKKPAAKKGKKK